MSTDTDRLRWHFRALDDVEVPDLWDEVDRHVRGPAAPEPSPQRRSIPRIVVPAALALLAIGGSVAGFAWLRAAFETTEPRPPAEPEGSGYVFSNVRVDPTEPGSEQELYFEFDVSWRDGTYPGIHRCTFRAIGADGQVVGEVVREMIAFRETTAKDGPMGVVLPQPSAAPVEGEVTCDPERLDTPGIDEIDPLDPELVREVESPGGRDLSDLFAELGRRTDAWADRFSVGDMTLDEVAGNLAALWYGAVVAPDRRHIHPWVHWEYSIRTIRLCREVPREDPLWEEYNCSQKPPDSVWG